MMSQCRCDVKIKWFDEDGIEKFEGGSAEKTTILSHCLIAKKGIRKPFFEMWYKG